MVGVELGEWWGSGARGKLEDAEGKFGGGVWIWGEDEGLGLRDFLLGEFEGGDSECGVETLGGGRG